MRVFKPPILKRILVLNGHVHDIVASLGVVWVVFEVLEIFKDAELYYYFVAGRNHYLNLHDAFSFALVFFEVGRI